MIKSATLPCVHPQHFFSFQSFFFVLKKWALLSSCNHKTETLNYFYNLYIFLGRSTHPLPHPTGGMFRCTAAKYKKVLLPSLHTRHLNGNPAMTSLFLFTFSYLVLAVAGEVFCQGEVTHTLTKNTLQFQY